MDFFQLAPLGKLEPLYTSLKAFFSVAFLHL